MGSMVIALVRPSVFKYLRDRSLFFSHFLHEVRDNVHTHFVTLIVKWTIVDGWVNPFDDKRGKVGTIKSPKNLA